jgi:anti-sigma regulatory factor (Ser/Thr protein kinase)
MSELADKAIELIATDKGLDPVTMRRKIVCDICWAETYSAPNASVSEALNELAQHRKNQHGLDSW